MPASFSFAEACYYYTLSLLYDFPALGAETYASQHFHYAADITCGAPMPQETRRRLMYHHYRRLMRHIMPSTLEGRGSTPPPLSRLIVDAAYISAATSRRCVIFHFHTVFFRYIYAYIFLISMISRHDLR